MKGKKLTALFTCAFLLTTSTLSYAWADSDSSGKAGKQGTAASGYIESDLDQDTPLYDSGIALYSDIPASYPDGGVDAIRQRYPENRNQNPYGTCWAFASTGLAEFDLINDGLASKDTVDFSELQLAYFTYNFVTDPLGGTEGDVARYYNDNATYSYLNRGGNFEYSLRRLSQWIGVADESDVSYSQAGATISGSSIDDKYAYGYDKAHLENAYEINIKQQPDQVKEMIEQNGAVGAMYYDRESAWGVYGDDSYTYYDTNRAGSGHAIMIVGWDDNFSKDNFKDGNKPAHDGAWLVRNSWGDYRDYFWMSYDTVSLLDTAWAFDFTGADNYDNNYQLDGGIGTYKVSNYTTVANVFTVGEKDGVTSESLKAVSLSMTREANVGYKIEIYTDLSDINDPTSGTLQESATTEGESAYAGYYTIPLNDEVKLIPGSSFSVVVTLDKAALDHESAHSVANGDNVIWDCHVNRDNSRSFYKYAGKFRNITYPKGNDGNLCIKAFTTNNTNETPVEEKHTVTFDANGANVTIPNKEVIKGQTYGDLPTPAREGYTFAGWFTDATAGTQVTASTIVELTADQTLYAHWTQNPVVEPEKTASEKVSMVKEAIEAAVNKADASNSLTQDDIHKLADAVLTSTGVEGVTVSVSDFVKKDATSASQGSVSANIVITCDNVTDKVVFNKTIAQLPKSDAEKVADAKAVVSIAVAGIEATNDLTKDNVQTEINDALKKADITDVTVTVGDLDMKAATSKADGSVKAIISLSCGTAKDTVSMDKSIAKLPKTDAEKVADAKAVVEAAVSAIDATNNLTKDDIQKAVDDALTKAGIAESKVVVEDFTKTDATTTASGKAKATISITCGTAKDSVIFDKKIAQLPNPEPSEPDKPSQPDKPRQPDKPSKPDKPGESDKPGIQGGKVDYETNVSIGDTKSDVSVDESKLKDTVLSAEQKKLVDDGGKADITLTMSDISKNVSDEQKELINSVLKSDDKVGMYVDISVLLTITNAEGNVITDKALVSETATKFTVKMKLADELLQKDSSKIRTYQVVRLHDGKSEILDSEWDASTGTLSFETDKFSTYAISYSDKDKEAVKEPTKDPVKNPTKDFDTDIKDGNKIDNSKPQVNSNVKTDSKQQTKDAIKTGDDNRVLFMFIVFIIAVAGVCVTVNRIVKKN